MSYVPADKYAQLNQFMKDVDLDKFLSFDSAEYSTFNGHF